MTMRTIPGFGSHNRCRGLLLTESKAGRALGGFGSKVETSDTTYLVPQEFGFELIFKVL